MAKDEVAGAGNIVVLAEVKRRDELCVVAVGEGELEDEVDIGLRVGLTMGIITIKS